MHTKGLEDALWKSHAAKNMVSAVRTAEPEVQRIYAYNIGDILRGAYRDFIRYGKDDEYFKDIMLSLHNVFADMPEIVFRVLPMELQLAASPLRQGKYAEAWKMLYMYKRMRALYYVRYFFLVMKHQIRNLTR